MTTKKQSTAKGGTKGKAEVGPRELTETEMRAGDLQTAEQIRAILSDPNTPSSVAGKLQTLINRLGEETDAPAPDSPDFYADSFAYAALVVRDPDDFRSAEARPAFEQVTRYAERHEPKDARLVRRLGEVLRDKKLRDEREAILDAINDFSNELPVSDLHPDIFPTLARVLIREARASLKSKGLMAYKRRLLRGHLQTLEEFAGA
jgi:hypothetical protein